jgi:preprotein translocase subunit YajC
LGRRAAYIMNGLQSLIPLVLVWLILYFVLIFPRQKKMRKLRQMIGNLRVNDEVLTSGGVRGRYVGRKDKLITLEVAPGVRFDVDPAKIESVSEGKAPPAQKKCSRCEASLDPSDRFCRQCSQPAATTAGRSPSVPPPPPPHARPPSPPPPPPARPRGAPVPSGMALCPRCRTPLPPGIFYCGECGTPVR